MIAVIWVIFVFQSKYIPVSSFRAPATVLTNASFCVANFTSSFLWLEDVILQNSSFSFEMIWEGNY